jgi:hypothetical protein
MSLNYSLTLIARPKEFIPSTTQVQAFMAFVTNEGGVPGTPEIKLRTPSTRTRSGVNPFTGEKVVILMKDHAAIPSIGEIARVANGYSDYEVEVSGVGSPAMPPLRIDFDEPYYVTITCNVSSCLRSTSDLHLEDDTQIESNPVSYGEPCTLDGTEGFFTDPQSGALIRVPEAGCSRFWIEFQLGKFLFPTIDSGNLEILNPELVRAAMRTFETTFVQGCHWG